MRAIPFDPDTLTGDRRNEWDTWQQKAAGARNTAVAAYKPGVKPNLDDRIWSDLKQWLLIHVFNGTCAYCETNFTASDYGDAEHYRPKGEVDGDPGHPGYFWLAYDWQNIIPACTLCNRAGKRTKFPTRNGHVVDVNASTAQLDATEQPLLLHPYAAQGREDPSDHLEFHPHGVIAPVPGSEHGAATIEVCALDRRALEEKRRAAQEAAQNAISMAIGDAMRGLKSLDDSLDRHMQPGAEYSSVWNAAWATLKAMTSGYSPHA